jgi:hypothetical protein
MDKRRTETFTIWDVNIEWGISEKVNLAGQCSIHQMNRYRLCMSLYDQLVFSRIDQCSLYSTGIDHSHIWRKRLNKRLLQ